jgi:hypothetical protein
MSSSAKQWTADVAQSEQQTINEMRETIAQAKAGQRTALRILKAFLQTGFPSFVSQALQMVGLTGVVINDESLADDESVIKTMCSYLELITSPEYTSMQIKFAGEMVFTSDRSVIQFVRRSDERDRIDVQSIKSGFTADMTL